MNFTSGHECPAFAQFLPIKSNLLHEIISLFCFKIFQTWYKNYVQANGNVQSSAYWTALNDIANGAGSQVGTGTWKWGRYSSTDSSVV